MSLFTSVHARAVCLLLVFGAALVGAVLPDGRLHANSRPMGAVPRVSAPQEAVVVSRNGTQLPPYNTTYYFDQLVDHTNPGAGTFKQRYWHTWEFYELGGPIIIMTPGEGNADGFDGYLTNKTLNGQLAQQEHGAAIVLEHRFFGQSNPRPDLSVDSLRLLTVQQAIDDFDYFAKTVKLPMPGGDQVGPTKAPWVMIGGSYSGALTSWTMVNIDTFYAGYASSAVVEATIDFWQYFEPIRQNMPANCSSDVAAVIEHVDKVFGAGNSTDAEALKAQFGMTGLAHLDDAAGALRNPIWEWQDLQVESANASSFYKFCDALEVKDNVSAPAAGWGVDHALAAWGSYFNNTYLPQLCNGTSGIDDCLGTYNLSQSAWTNTTLDQSTRSWTWLTCTELGFFQEGAPDGSPTIVSRLMQPEYDMRQCRQMFQGAFTADEMPNVNATNTAYRGRSVRTPRLFFANGQRDPWLDTTVSATGYAYDNTPAHPAGLSDGFHCSDLGTKAGVVDATVAAVQKQGLDAMKAWLAEWPGAAPGNQTQTQTQTQTATTTGTTTTTTTAIPTPTVPANSTPTAPATATSTQTTSGAPTATPTAPKLVSRLAWVRKDADV